MSMTIARLEELAVNDPGALIKPGEVADLFRVDPKTVTRWGQAGRLAVVNTPGGHHRFRADVVFRAYMAGLNKG
jgi:predicted site-specific integrase-resolvase